MKFLDELERKFSRYVPYNITKILIAGQVLSFILIYSNREYASYFYLNGKMLLQGQIWRLATMLFAPVSDNMLFWGLALYFFYMFGTALENQWGTFRYAAYIAIGYIALIAGALISPDIVISNIYLYSSLFLAFAHLYPKFQVLLFFVLPIQIKWLGYLAWLGILVSFLSGSIPDKILIFFSVVNFLLFFYDDILFFLKGASKHSKSAGLIKQKPNHICAVCGTNEIDNRNMEIRYCSQCFPTTCYCGEHISRHQHKRPVN